MLESYFLRISTHPSVAHFLNLVLELETRLESLIMQLLMQSEVKRESVCERERERSLTASVRQRSSAAPPLAKL